MSDPNDDLAEILAPRNGQLTAERRAAILVETERRLATDRWVRRGARVALVAGVFLAGGLAGWMARVPVATAPGSPEPAIEFVAVPVVVPIVANPEVHSPVTPVAALSASEAELRAEQQDDSSAAAKLYREAGDVFLREENYSNATRCYRLFLQRGGDSALTLESHDSWLLVSLKNTAFKEKVNAAKNDG